ncbi:metal-dependent hydrolase [Rathayibacter sp. VKM Ac-2803]|uniref:metal-dependent hydrolase n=1 Tax=unclassified Rathayibacter TaxID=2609250 RepID=UPI00135CDD33|nr:MULTISPECIES: metal-dependent hydrolase [unclassified Rathayibacter]MWV50743.1 metal-dependent hydrolase [Rathayibacter sp. VKM Ac-2803]MWV57224.1 metal-dependent hydrolase [Rathayibacter sp. VKM Ac-2754]
MIDSDTLVTYPDRATSGTSAVVHVEELGDGRWGVVLAETPAHPVDPTWPDQGPDRGVLVVDGVRHEILDCRIGAWQDGTLHAGDRLPARLGTPGWSFVVVHVLRDPVAVGARVAVEVDVVHREELSRGHTACHLASLALNAAVAGLWSKDTRPDSLGNPDFDQAAIQSSVIRSSGSTDVYRLGRSLRRSGFDAARLRDELPAVTERIDAQLGEWIRADAEVRIDRDDSRLSTRRSWRCHLTPDGDAAVSCGGTHVSRLRDLGRVSVALTLEDDGTALRMETDVSL